MAHLGEEDGFGIVGGFGKLHRLLQLFRHLPVQLRLALDHRAHRQHVGVIDGHPGHVDGGGEDRDPADRRKPIERHGFGKAERQIGGDHRHEVGAEQADHEKRPIRQVEEAEQQRDEQPGQERRTDAAIEEGAEERGEGQKLDRQQRRNAQIVRGAVDEGQRQEGADADHDDPEGNAGIRHGAVEIDADPLRQQRSDQMREDEVARHAQFRTLKQWRIGNEPVDDPEDLLHHGENALPVAPRASEP